MIVREIQVGRLCFRQHSLSLIRPQVIVLKTLHTDDARTHELNERLIRVGVIVTFGRVIRALDLGPLISEKIMYEVETVSGRSYESLSGEFAERSKKKRP